MKIKKVIAGAALAIGIGAILAPTLALPEAAQTTTVALPRFR
jgi:hypothetical protein